MFGILAQNPILFIIVFLILVITISVHEFAHAYVANKLGDPTPRYLGRLTLNPKAHLDPIGTLMLVFVGFGWGKPVPINPGNLANPKVGSALVALAGPMSNLLFAVVFALLLKFVGTGAYVGVLTYRLIAINLTLCFFNLIPLHPLDGFKVVYGVLPHSLAYQWEQMESYGIYILVLLLFTNSIGNILAVPTNLFFRIFGL